MLTFQTMVQDLTAMEISNSSLLDEATAAAEAMAMVVRSKVKRRKKNVSTKKFLISNLCHPNTIAIVQVRAEPMGVEAIVVDHKTAVFDQDTIGVLLQYPATDGTVESYASIVSAAKKCRCNGRNGDGFDGVDHVDSTWGPGC